MRGGSAGPPSAHDLVVVGAINADLVVAAPRLPGPGETVVGPRVEQFGGGKGANAAVAAARAGAVVRLVGAVGTDDTGARTIQELRAEGIDVAAVTVLDGEATGVALIVVDPDGENQIAVGAGANAALTGEQVRGALTPILPSAGCALISTEIPADAVAAAVEVAASAGVRCVLNPAPPPLGADGLLEMGPITTPNAAEASELASLLADADGRGRAAGPAGEAEILARARWAGERIAARTRAPVVITLGSDGALIVDPDGAAQRIGSPPVTVRDTTGAGDTFNGVLAHRLARGDGLPAATRVAVAAAALSVAESGARSGMPDHAAIKGMLESM